MKDENIETKCDEFITGLKKLRVTKDVSREELAKKTGLFAMDIKNIESRAYKPSLDTLVRIAEALNVKLQLVAKSESCEFKKPLVEIKKVWFDKTNIYVQLFSGHVIGNPLKWYTRLNNSSQKQRESYEIDNLGETIIWKEIEEELSLETLLDLQRELSYGRV